MSKPPEKGAKRTKSALKSVPNLNSGVILLPKGATVKVLERIRAFSGFFNHRRIRCSLAPESRRDFSSAYCDIGFLTASPGSGQYCKNFLRSIGFVCVH